MSSENTSGLEESNMVKNLPFKFYLDTYKVLEWKWFNSRSCVGVVLVWDLQENRMLGFMGSARGINEKADVIGIANWGHKLPAYLTNSIFYNYLTQQRVYEVFDKQGKESLDLLGIVQRMFS